MNNLLRTLSESKVKTLPDVDLKLLLSTVKEGRGKKDEHGLSNAFYESLEGVLADLKTVTLDNHDAEPFLKPVLRAEVADYYDVISNPMDFQTMTKKLKARQYKSKKEFKDDLDLIWSNCFTYNSTEGHHLPKAAARLQGKAEKLLANITDRKERIDPHIPNDFAPPGSFHPKINGINGRAHTRSPSLKPLTIAIKSSSVAKAIKVSRQPNTAFEESPALVRTPEGMAMFRELDQSLHAGPSSSANSRMRQIISSEQEDEYDSEAAQVGDKRKVVVVNGTISDSSRAHKRARFATPLPIPDSSPGSPMATTPTEDDLAQLWWSTVQSDALLPNGLPEIPFAFSSSSKKKKKRRRKVPDSYRAEDKPKALLTLMNNNVRTIKRVRRTHAKFAALGLAKESAAGGSGGGTGNDDDNVPEAGFNPPAGGSGGGGPGLGGGGMGMSLNNGDVMDVDEAVEERVDERPWEVPARRGIKLSGIEMGSKNADDCVRWMNGKVLEHVGFQGTSKVALDVLSGVASEYLLNVGRTIKFLVDKFANTMTPEEIVLHTLFESGISGVQDLERYVADDVERYGSRLADLEKKLIGAYREVTSVDTVEDEGLFDEEEEDENSALALGEFADMLGVDYFGLRELGIADEFGMSSLTIPKRLLKGKKKRENLLPVAKPTEPPLPFPPPPPFIPLTAAQIPEQIGLLQKFYQDRLQAVAPTPPQPVPSAASIPPLAPPPLPGPSLANLYPSIPSLPKPTIPSLPGPSGTLPLPTPPPSNVPSNQPSSSSISSSAFSQQPPQQSQTPPDTIIPDDSPTPLQAKMGPLGQIVKSGSSHPTAKKKAKAATAAAAAAAVVGAGANANGTAAAAASSSSSSNHVGAGVGSSYPPTGIGTNSSSTGAGAGTMPNGVGVGVSVNGILGPDGSASPVTGIPAGFAGSSPSPKKKKGAAATTGVGSGNGGKKKQAQAQNQNQNQNNQPPGQGQDQRPPSFPPAVTASA